MSCGRLSQLEEGFKVEQSFGENGSRSVGAVKVVTDVAYIHA